MQQQQQQKQQRQQHQNLFCQDIQLIIHVGMFMALTSTNIHIARLSLDEEGHEDDEWFDGGEGI